MARPVKEIDKKSFEALLHIGCGRSEIVGFFDETTEGGISDDTLNRWCKRTYKASFAEILDKRRALMKIQLRKNQLELSKRSAAMAIWLGKQYLGQRDNPQVGMEITIAEDGLSKSLRELADGLESDNV